SLFQVKDFCEMDSYSNPVSPEPVMLVSVEYASGHNKGDGSKLLEVNVRRSGKEESCKLHVSHEFRLTCLDEAIALQDDVFQFSLVLLALYIPVGKPWWIASHYV